VVFSQKDVNSLARRRRSADDKQLLWLTPSRTDHDWVARHLAPEAQRHADDGARAGRVLD
jgi:hypothetical protein